MGRPVMRDRAETVLVVGTETWAGQPTARSLARAGFRVVGAGVLGRIAGKTRYCVEQHAIPAGIDRDALVERVNQICVQEAVDVVVPLTDEFLGALLFGGAVGRAWKIAGPTPDEFNRFCNKAALIETASAASVASPASAIVGPEGARGPLPPMPAYVKLVTGPESGRAIGRPLRVTDEEACNREVGRLTAQGDTVLIQEEVVGRQLRFHFVRWRGEIVHLAARTVANYPFRVGPSTVSEFLLSPRELVEVSVSLLEAGDFDGFGVIQTIERGGIWYVHDVNLRMPSSVDATVAAGLDMPSLAVEIALGRRPDLSSTRVRPLRHLQLNGEVRALRDALAGSDVGRSARTIAAGLAVGVVAPGQRVVPLDLTDPLPTLAALSALRHRPVRGGSGSPSYNPSGPTPVASSERTDSGT